MAFTPGDIDNAKLDTVSLAEQATSKAGGVDTGADITQGITRFGDTFKTLKGIEADADAAIAAISGTVEASVAEAGNIYPDTAAGLAATTNGQYFKVIGAGDIASTTYLNNSGAAVFVVESPSSDYVKSIVPDIGIDGVEFSVTDENGLRSWLEVGPDGGPTEHSKQTISEIAKGSALENVGLPDVSFTVTDEDGLQSWVEIDSRGLPTKQSEDVIRAVLAPEINLPDISVSIVDEDGRRSWLEADGTGGIPSRVAEAIHDAIQPFNQAASPQNYEDPITNVSYKVSSGPDIVAIGDSMTAGAGSNGNPYSGYLATLTGLTVRNAGVGGESSVTIAARMGAYPYALTFEDGEIPAGTTPTPVRFERIDGSTPRPLLQGNGGGTQTAILQPSGIRGTLSVTNPTAPLYTEGQTQYFFTRSEAGTQVPINRTQYFLNEYAIGRQEDIYIIWIGQNGPSDTRAIQDARALIESMRTAHKKFLVIPRPTANETESLLWFKEFGNRAVLATEYIITPIYDTDGVTVISSYGLDDAGITPTAGDITDIENGIVPRSLRADFVHWTAAGYEILANLIHQRMIQLGWI